MSIRVTHHACERFVERVEACSIDDARLRIMASARAIEAAAEFGCQVVRRAHGERLILEGTSVVSVYGASDRPRQIRSPHRQIGGEP